MCTLPTDVRWSHIVGAGLLGGIGFTMSIFITNLAFADHAAIVNSSKLAVLAASLIAGVLGFAVAADGAGSAIGERAEAMPVADPIQLFMNTVVS